MRDGHWILAATIIICLGLSSVVGRDEYEAKAFLEQFRRQFRRQPQNFQSRDGSNEYRGVSPDAASSSSYTVEDDNYEANGDDGGGGSRNSDHYYNRVYGSTQYRHRSPYGLNELRLQQPFRVGIVEDNMNSEKTPTHNQISKENDNRIDVNLETVSEQHRRQQLYEPVRLTQVEDKFKVETRARIRQPPYVDRTSGFSEHPMEKSTSSPVSDMYFIAVVAGCSAAAIFGVMAAGFCWYKFQKNAKAAAEAEYPAYGVTGPNREHISPSSGGDRKLAQNAQMYHYQHQKQQMIAMEKTNGERHASTSDVDSEEENDEGDYTVYECPGLAPTGEMEVKNPLFQDDPTPGSPLVLGRTPLNSGTSEDSSK